MTLLVLLRKYLHRYAGVAVPMAVLVVAVGRAVVVVVLSICVASVCEALG